MNVGLEGDHSNFDEMDDEGLGMKMNLLRDYNLDIKTKKNIMSKESNTEKIYNSSRLNKEHPRSEKQSQSMKTDQIENNQDKLEKNIEKDELDHAKPKQDKNLPKNSIRSKN